MEPTIDGGPLPPVVAVEGPKLEKLRTAPGRGDNPELVVAIPVADPAPRRGAVLLRFRECCLNMGTVGGEAASPASSLSLSSIGSSSFTGGGKSSMDGVRLFVDGVKSSSEALDFLLPKDSLLCLLLGLRTTFLRMLGADAGDSGRPSRSPWGMGGTMASSSMLRDEWLRKDSAVSHTKCRSMLTAVNFSARCGVSTRIDRLNWL